MRRIIALIAIVLSTFGLVTVSWAADSASIESGQAEELSLERAVSRALSFSKALEKADLDVEKADEATVPAKTGYSPDEEGQIVIVETTYFAYESALKARNAMRDAIVMSVYDKYYTVLKALQDVKAKEKALARAEQDLRITQAMVAVGMANRVALEGARAGLTRAQADLAASRAALDNAYAALNQLVGFAEDKRPVLVDVPEFKPLEADLATCINRVLDDSPTIWTAEAAAELKRTIANMTPPTGSGLQAVSDEDVEKAELDAATAKDATRLLVRSLFNAVKNLEDARAAAEQGVLIAKENLRITEAKFSVGLATKKDVTAAEADLASAEKALFEITAQHAYMKLALEKPWAYLSVLAQSGGAGSSSGGTGGGADSYGG